MGANLSQIGMLAQREIEARIAGPLIKAFMAEIGKERALEIAQEVITGLARDSGKELRELAEGGSLEDFAKATTRWSKDNAATFDLLEFTPEKLSLNTTRCRYAEMYRELGMPELGFALSCARDFALVEGFNPQIELKRTQTIGLIAPDLANPFFAAIIKSAERVAHQSGYSLIVCDTDEDIDMEAEQLNLLRSKGVDGLVILPVGQKAGHIQALVTQRFPVVVVDRSVAGCNASSVVIDNYLGAHEAVNPLLSRGHRQVAIIQGLPGTSTALERRRGYLDAMEREYGHVTTVQAPWQAEAVARK